jgi:hypothetical protein
MLQRKRLHKNVNARRGWPLEPFLETAFYTQEKKSLHMHLLMVLPWLDNPFNSEGSFLYWTECGTCTGK